MTVIKKRLNSSDKVRDGRGRWVLIMPIFGLSLTEATNFEFQINKVTLIQGDKLARRRKRFWIRKPLSKHHPSTQLAYSDLLEATNCVAIIFRDGRLVDFETKMLQLIEEEVALLALSQLGWIGDREKKSSLGANHGMSSGIRKYSVINAKDGKGYFTAGSAVGSGPLHLDQGWKYFQQKYFYFRLLRIIRGEVTVDELWRRDLENAAILAGKSQLSKDITEAFLWNMIAIEMLLTEQGDKVVDLLPQRSEAFLGWTDDWKTEEFESRIRNAYSKRCQIVHQGRRDITTIKDLNFSDALLLNLFLNIAKHPKVFDSKRSVIDFSRKVEAENLLGIESKVQPTTLQFVRNLGTSHS